MRCAACGTEISDGNQVYTLRVDLFAAKGDLEVLADEMGRNRSAEIESLVAKLEDMDEDELEEQEQRVFERHTFTLCAVCRAEIHDRLRGMPGSKNLH